MEGPETNGAESQKSAHIRQRLFRNSTTVMGCRIVTAATAILAVPFVTKKIGLEGFGLWESFMAVATLAAMVQQALVATLLYRFAQAFGAGRPEEMRRLVRISVTLTLATIVVVVPVIYGFRHRLVDGLNAPPDLVAQAVWILPVVAFFVLVASLNDIMGAYLSGNQQMGMVVVVQAIGIVIQYSVSIAVMYSGFGFTGLLVGFVAMTLWNGVVLFRMLKRNDPELTLRPAVPQRAELQELGKYGGLLLVGQISQSLRDQTPKLILASFASPIWTGYYGIAARLAALVLEASRFFYNPLVASAGALHASGDWEGVRKLYRTMITAVAIGAGTIAAILAGASDRVLTLWLGHPVPEASKMLLILLVGNTTAVMLTGPGTAICRAAGKVWIETMYIVVNLVSNLVLTILLVATVGPQGAVISSGLTWAVSSMLFSGIMHRYIDLPKDATVRARGLTLLACVSSLLIGGLSAILPASTTRAHALMVLPPLTVLTAVVYLGGAMALGLLPRDLLTRATRVVSRRLGLGGKPA
ncbi:MAG: lipopolysaccharide biosynthesis protein [Fimbriimonas sp.]